MNIKHLFLSLIFCVSIRHVHAQQNKLTPTENMALITFTVVNLDSVVQSDAIVIFESMDKTVKGEGKVDKNGQYMILLPEGKKFKLQVKKEKTLDFGYLQVPQEKGPVRIQHVMKYDVLSEKFEELTPESGMKATDELCLMKFKITDYDSVPEQGAVVKYESVDLAISGKGIADLDGNFMVLIPEGKVYKLRVEKFGKSFDFGQLTLPEVKGPLHYTQLLRIRVINKYIKTYTLDNIYFETNADQLKPESFKTLNGLYDALKVNLKQKIEIAGHTDQDGSNESNLRLSQARANSVKKFLVNRGISDARIIAKGYGELEPIADNNTPEGKKTNRRTEVRVIEE